MLFPRRLRLLRRSLILGVLAALAVFVPGVAAHAELVRSVPESDAVLAQAPDRIELFFSEAVDPNFTVIQVLNSSAAPVDKHDTRLDPADPTHVTVSLLALPDGVYTVSWRALSAADGHVTSGAFPFTVGLAAAAPAATLAWIADTSAGDAALPVIISGSALAMVASCAVTPARSRICLSFTSARLARLVAASSLMPSASPTWRWLLAR